MAVTTYQHGKKTYVGIKATGGGGFTDISAYVATSTVPYNREEHDTTTYGADVEKTFQGGNVDRTMDLAGRWNSTFAGIIDPLVPVESVTVRIGKQGSAAGKPYAEYTGFFTKYEDPNDSGDIDQWTASIRVSGPAATGVFP